MNIYLLVLWLVTLTAAISAVVIGATDKRVRHGHGRSISPRGLIAVIGEQTNPWTFEELNDEATAQLETVRHSLYPILIVFPLGLLATAVAFDIVALVTGDSSWFNTAFLVMGAGILCGLLAALPGLADWVAISKNTRTKAIGLWHGGGNVVVLLLFAISWFIRRGRAEVPNTEALVLSFIAAALALITSWLGGELVDRLSVGVDNGAQLNAPSSLSGRPATAEPVQPMRRAS
jgi:uncharacterized membrane protein